MRFLRVKVLSFEARHVSNSTLGQRVYDRCNSRSAASRLYPPIIILCLPELLKHMEANHPLTPQLIAAINHYGLEDVLTCLAEATVEVSNNMEAVGTDPGGVGKLRAIAGILAQAATV